MTTHVGVKLDATKSSAVKPVVILLVKSTVNFVKFLLKFHQHICRRFRRQICHKIDQQFRRMNFPLDLCWIAHLMAVSNG